MSGRRGCSVPRLRYLSSWLSARPLWFPIPPEVGRYGDSL